MENVREMVTRFVVSVLGMAVAVEVVCARNFGRDGKVRTKGRGNRFGHPRMLVRGDGSLVAENQATGLCRRCEKSHWVALPLQGIP